MSGPTRGLYEVIVTESLEKAIVATSKQLHSAVSDLRPAEAADRLGLHLGQIVQRYVGGLPEEDRVQTAISVLRRVIRQLLVGESEADLAEDLPKDPASVLRSISEVLPSGDPEVIPLPMIPLLDTTLLTNAPGEPRVGNQILAEVYSADRVDVVMAFIRRSGIAPLLDAIKVHCGKGRPVRVLTTTYTGSTECEALIALSAAGAEVRVSYDTTSTRLHAKAWLFRRESGFSTAYIGSSNLTHSAQISGLEWNVRVSGVRNRDVVEKVEAVFESYWNGGDFIPFVPEEFRLRTETKQDDGQPVLLSAIELRPEPFQERLLELISVSRAKGFHRNLLVSATGTGKTVMAAIDYAQLVESMPRARLLFVAHREEILTQTLATFRYCMRDPAFGELWVGGQKPKRFEHVFASVQSLSQIDLGNLAADHFDVVIVDEFHHAAAPTYKALLDHLKPVELLGLTATPERSDGLPLLGWFDNRIAAELRLWDAIDQHRLCPFLYYGVSDGMDLREVPWRRGKGYDSIELSKVYTANDAWAKQVLSQLRDRVDSIKRIRCLGFCVSVEHARFMAEVFSTAGLPSVAVWAETPNADRSKALNDLAAGRVNVVFSVDLFNEGIDVPSVDTLLMLRPTESPTLFLQQLGRGLRRHRTKTCCVVLDFVGLHRKEFRFDRKLIALLGGTRKELLDKVSRGFPFLPAGCHMELDAVASREVLNSIKNSLPSRWPEKVEELRKMALGRPEVSLSEFLVESGLALDDVYGNDRGWSRLCEDAGLPMQHEGPKEEALRRACARLLHVDDFDRINSFRQILRSDLPPDLRALDERGRRVVRMLVSQLVDKAVDKSMTLESGLALVWQHPQVRLDVLQLLDVLEQGVDHVHAPIAGMSEVPLQVHARYTRLEILASFGIGEAAKVAPWQTGVYWAEDSKTDIFAFTLDKTEGRFSPTTRYRDYAISRDLIHWESQGVTRADSATGQRYQGHIKLGTKVVLFARLKSDDRSFWCLGPAEYVSHVSERPMAITWRLKHSLPGDLFAAFAAAVA